MTTYRIRNWDKYQAFQDGRPIKWLKLDVGLIDNFEYHKTPELAAKYLSLLWILAAKNSGDLPNIETIAFRLRLDVKKTTDILQTLVEYRFVEVRENPYESVRNEDESVRIRSLEKRREEVEIEESREELLSADEPPPPIVPSPLDQCLSEIVNVWNAHAPKGSPKPLAKILGLTPKRIKLIKARWKESDVWKNRWREIPAAVVSSEFHCGLNDRDWTADFDFILQPSKAESLLERAAAKAQAPKARVW
jgi:DNA-binding MarR family transcriptional regulator